MLETVKYLLGSAGASGYGSKSTAEQVTDSCPDLSSFTAIITGATSGIGAETARVLAKRGVRLVLPARSLKAAEEAKARLASDCPGSDIVVMPLDLSSLSSVRNFVSQFHSLNLPLNLLINNAGKFAHQHAVSEDGIEMTFATNYLGHFLLTKLLLKRMIETAKVTGIQGRIVNVSSSIHGWFSGDMIRYLGQISGDKSHYDATRAYALSKLANVLHTKELAQRLKQMEANVTVNCVHPGIVRTRLTREREGFITDLVFFLTSKLLKTIPQGAATTCYVAIHPRLVNVSGKYFADCNEAWTSKLGWPIKLIYMRRIYKWRTKNVHGVILYHVVVDFDLEEYLWGKCMGPTNMLQYMEFGGGMETCVQAKEIFFGNELLLPHLVSLQMLILFMMFWKHFHLIFVGI